MLNHKKTITTLTIFIVMLSGIAAGIGIFSKQVVLYDDIKTSFGEVISLYQKGVYARDSVSMASQAIAQDIVTVVLGIPILVIALLLTMKEKKKGMILLTGTAGYFLYTYTSYAFLVTYNYLYLVYVALMTSSFFLFFLCMMNLSKIKLKEQFTERFPRKSLPVFFDITGFMIGMMWLGRIVPTIFSGTAPEGLEQYSTLGIQTLDLGFVVPACFLAAYLLRKGKQWGYLLAMVLTVKAITMTAAVSAMTILMHLNGVSVSLMEKVLFPTLFLICTIFMVKILKSLRE